MMSTSLRAVVTALALTAGVAATGTAQTAVPKIGYINSQTILAQAPGRAEAEAQFEREMTSFRQTVQKMGDSLNLLIANYNKEEVSLSPAAKETRQKAIRAKEEEYSTKTRQLEQQAQQRQMELVEPIMKQINAIITELRRQEGYAMIFDAGSNAGVVVAADSSLNLTDKVLTRLKAAGPARPAAPSAARPTAPAARPAGAPVSAPAGVTRPKSPPTE